jgi:hypothetical protein
MAKDLQFPDPTPDRELAAALAPLLTPPTDTPAYWDGLEVRILAHIQSAPAWWIPSPTTLRAGMAAAGLAVLALGALALQTRQTEARLALRAVTETPLEVAAPIPGIDARPSRYAPVSPPATLPRR